LGLIRLDTDRPVTTLDRSPRLPLDGCPQLQIKRPAQRSVLRLRRRRFARSVAVLAALAFVGRCAYVLTFTRFRTSFDEFYYKLSAISLAHGHGFRFTPSFLAPIAEYAEHPPFTSIVLAPVALVSGDNEFSMHVAVALAGAGVVVLVALLAREVAGARAGLIAAAIATVYPNLWMNDGALMSETFATLATAGAVLCSYRLIRKPTMAAAATGGALCALAMLSRSELALLVPFLVLPVVFRNRVGWPKRFRLAGVAVGITVLIVAPWVVYNVGRFERPVLLSYGDGGVIAGANCRRTYFGRDIGLWNGSCSTSRGLPENSVNAEAKRELGLEYARSHLTRVPWVVTARVGRLWNVYQPIRTSEKSYGAVRPMWAAFSGLGLYYVLMAFGVGGVIALRRIRITVLPLLAPVLVVTISAAAFYGTVRFRSPAEVSIVVLAAVGLDALLRRSAARRLRREPIPAREDMQRNAG
jgi:4-amino-4-deoxy-L-arabinose transferase-like glycosyltransferase